MVFMNLVTVTDKEFDKMIEGIKKPPVVHPPTVMEDLVSVPRNSYLEHRAKQIERDQARLLSLNLVDKDVADRTVRDAWDLSHSAFDNDSWCDFNTMTIWNDTDNFGLSPNQNSDEQQMTKHADDSAVHLDGRKNGKDDKKKNDKEKRGGDTTKKRKKNDKKNGENTKKKSETADLDDATKNRKKNTMNNSNGLVCSDCGGG